MIIQANGVFGGTATGKAVVIKKKTNEVKTAESSTPEKEKERLDKAAFELSNELKRLISLAKGEEKEILNGRLAIISDPYLILQIKEEIIKGKTAEKAVVYICENICSVFSGDGRLSERAYDIKETAERLIELLSGSEKTEFGEFKDRVAVFETITVNQVMKFKRSPPAAVITQCGGELSHSAILLRAAGIPAVFNLKNALELISDGDTVTVNGFTGKVIINPNEKEISECSHIKPEREKPDFSSLKIYANISNAEEADIKGAQGIGLFRTEFIFQSQLPSEEEQFQEYIKAAGYMKGKPVTIRTLDAARDKECFSIKSEKRGIAFSLENEEFFKTQLRAILRAAARGNIKMLLPFVTELDEVKRTKNLIEECEAELEERGLNYKRPPIGVMIETPPAVELSALLAKDADFFSIGTNDLTAGILKLKREKVKISDALNPLVLSAIEKAVKSAKENDLEVTVCGEAAANAEFLTKIIRYGVDAISVSPSLIEKIKTGSWPHLP